MLAPCRDAAVRVWILALARACSTPALPPPAPPLPSRARWERFDETRAWPLVAPAWPAHGHGIDAALVEVRASPGSETIYRSLTERARFSAGTTIVAAYRKPSGAALSTYAMTKRDDGAWEYVVTEPDGVLTARGALSSCEACHGEALGDHLFGIPHPPGN